MINIMNRLINIFCIFILVSCYLSLTNISNDKRLFEASNRNLNEYIYINLNYDNYEGESFMVGNNGVLDFSTDYYDNSNIFDASNIEQKTSFQLTITNLKGQKEDYITNCNFAKKADKRLILFCKLSNNFPQRLSHFSVTERTYYYNGYTFLITANGNGFRVYQYYEKLPVLYNDKQIINVKNSVNTYELKFKINDYDNQILFLCEDIENYLNLVPLNDCSKSGNYLSCKLSKSEIEGVYKNINICFYMFYGNYTKINLIEDIMFNMIQLFRIYM